VGRGRAHFGDSARGVEQHIRGFDVAVYNGVVMQELQARRHLTAQLHQQADAAASSSRRATWHAGVKLVGLRSLDV
jgi:hypothetical protein